MAKGKDQFVGCSFCGTPKHETQMLVAGQGVHICDKCIEQANEILSTEKTNRIQKPLANVKIPNPIEIKQHLDAYVIGQEDAKKHIAVAVYNHFKRIGQAKSDIEIEKSNLILVGETGTGKTLLAKTIARILQVPFCIVDATVLTERT
jgi:ATP-dependent Clp protease ATP-binding subunit ClpX